jgi:hypothetical protein
LNDVGVGNEGNGPSQGAVGDVQDVDGHLRDGDVDCGVKVTVDICIVSSSRARSSDLCTSLIKVAEKSSVDQIKFSVGGGESNGNDGVVRRGDEGLARDRKIVVSQLNVEKGSGKEGNVEVSNGVEGVLNKVTVVIQEEVGSGNGSCSLQLSVGKNVEGSLSTEVSKSRGFHGHVVGSVLGEDDGEGIVGEVEDVESKVVVGNDVIRSGLGRVFISVKISGTVSIEEVSQISLNQKSSGSVVEHLEVRSVGGVVGSGLDFGDGKFNNVDSSIDRFVEVGVCGPSEGNSSSRRADRGGDSVLAVQSKGSPRGNVVSADHKDASEGIQTVHLPCVDSRFGYRID